MGQQLTTSLHIESVGVLEPKDLVVLSHAFDGLKPVMREGAKVISEESFCTFLKTTVPIIGPFSRIVYEVFCTPKTNGIKFQDFCLAIQSLTYVGRDDKNEESIASLVFKHFEAKGTGHMNLNGIIKMGRLIENQKGFDKKRALELLASAGVATPNKGFTQPEFTAFFMVCVPIEQSFGTDTTADANKARLYNSMPFMREDLEPELAKEIPPVEPPHPKLRRPFEDGESVDIEGLEEILGLECVLPERFANVAMKVFGNNGKMTVLEYNELKNAVSDNTFGVKVFEQFDGDRDGVWTIRESIEAGRALGIQNSKNNVKTWMNIKRECGVLYGKEGITVEWFLVNMFLLE